MNEKDIPLELDYTFVRMVQEKSCSGENIKVAGEFYVTKDPAKQIAISKRKQIILKLAISLGVLTVVGAGIKVTGDMDSATDVRKEITKQESVQNPIGGSYEKENIYNQDFVNYTNSLTDSELMDLYSYISDQMDDDKTKVPDVVNNMEDNYLEENKKN